MTTTNSSAVYNPRRSAENIFQNRRARRVVVEPDFPARDAVVAQLEELVHLEPGWDGYRALGVSFDNASFALRVLEQICDHRTPAPYIVPGPNGDLQLEWHVEGGDIELHVRGPYQVEAWWRHANGDEDGEFLALTNDFTILAERVNEIVEPVGAHTAAAA